MEACFDWYTRENLAGRLDVHFVQETRLGRKPTHTPGNRVGGTERTKEVSLAGGSMVEYFETVGRGYQYGEESVDSGYRGGGRLLGKSTRKPSTVTPPMTLPDRGWGDGGGAREGRRRRRRAGASCFSFPYVPEHCSYGDVSRNTSCGGVSGSSASSTATMDTTSISSSSSTSDCSIRVGNDNSKSGGISGGVKVVDCSGESVAFFELSDGFSSAEEETWGSEGEIEESTAVGRRALVNADGLIPSSLTWCQSVRRIASPLVGRQLDDAQLRLIRAAPLCGSIVAGLRGVNDRSRLAASAAAVIDSRKAAAKMSKGELPGTGRKGCQVEERIEASGKGVYDSGERVSMGKMDICDRGGAYSSTGKERKPWKPALRLARPLFIDIEQKASEPIMRADEESHAGHGSDEQRSGRWHVLNGNGVEGDGAEFDDENLLCGCAEICIMVARGWYRYLAGGVRFSRLLQSAPSPLERNYD